MEPVEEQASQADKEESYCMCGEGFYGRMVGCDGPRCAYGGWFHFECVGLSRLPRGEWLCHDCRNRALRCSARRAEREKRAAEAEQCENNSRKRRLSKFWFERPGVEEYVPEGEEAESSGPLKVRSAEWQSRLAMDEMLREARPAKFIDSGAVDASQCPEIAGLARFTLDETTFAALESLHGVVVERLRRDRRLTAWAGVSEGDGRQRGYAFLPPSMGRFGKTKLEQAGVKFHSANKTGRYAAADEAANWRSCVRLRESDLSDDHRRALEAIAAKVRAIVPSKYKKLADTAHIEAIQPNLHNGLDHLPPHIDYPLNDGFGVIIVTLSVKSDANILLLPDRAACNENHGASMTKPSLTTPRRHRNKRRTASRACCSFSTKPYFFEVKRGMVYVLAGPARNNCDHGVVCSLPATRFSTERMNDNRDRESLNLRFGLHSAHKGQPFYVIDEMPIILKDRAL